jgi:hypothetical protein
MVQFNLPQVSDNCALNPAQLIQVFGLPSGSVFPAGKTYQVFRYTDPSGNVGQCEFEVNVAEAVVVTLSHSAATCSNACDGTATLTQNSGGNFNLIWSNGQTGMSLSNLCPGTYTASITDAFNCAQNLSAAIVVNDVISPTLSCPSNISAGYCTGPINYSQPQVSDNCPVNPANLQLIGGLASGALFPVGNTVQTYAYNDGAGNSGQCSFTVSITGPATINTSTQAVTCAALCNGSASISVSGGNSPFSIQWSNGFTGLNNTNLCAGNYMYTLTDFSGCEQAGAVSITEPLPFSLSIVQVLNDHGNTGVGSIVVNISGGTPVYTYNWTKNGVFFANTKNLSNLFQGQYLGVATDMNGCTSTVGPITVSNTVGTKIPEWAQSLTVSPNPATDWVYLDFGTPLEQAAELRVYDVNGQLAAQQTLSGTEQQVGIDVSTFASGVWMVRIQTKDGQSIVRKVVVVR